MTAEEIIALDQLERARVELRETLDELGVAMVAFREQRDAGLSVAQAYQKTRLRDVRDRVHQHLANFERAFTFTRATGIRFMVDQEGMTLTDVARLMRRSRQFVTRLYRTPPPDA